ncbi:MAG: FadR family transcriptional regulator [Phycisphaerae bacterium]|nr:FadR family transcriptional regulator [Phycisphaerae bacterium]
MDGSLDKEHLHKKIAKEIIALVASGTYQRGQRLPAERTLCLKFGVSRGTLRKALAKLVELRVVKIKPNSGIFVENPSPEGMPRTYLPPEFESASLCDIIEARKAIELAAVEQACRGLKKSDVQALEFLLERMRENLDDLTPFLQADMEFHQQLVQASGNVVLRTAFLAIYDYHRFSSVFTSQHEGEEEAAYEFHQKLLSALKRKDAPVARRILKQHLDHIVRYESKTPKK